MGKSKGDPREGVEYSNFPYHADYPVHPAGTSQDNLVDPAMAFRGQPGMPHQMPPHRNLQKQDESTAIYRYLLFAYNLIFFLCGCVLLGVGIWIAVDRSFMATIAGNPLYAVAAYIIIAGGGLIFIISFLGCCGAMTQNRIMLLVFTATLIFICLILFIGAILAIIFRTQLSESIQDTMSDTLRDNYGVELHDDFNRAVTKAWDKAQEKLRCCAVSKEGWALYRDSKWYNLYGAKDGQSQQQYSYEEHKPYVPRSCCVQDRFDRYINRDVCQKWRIGPPSQPSGAINRALYYTGCYDAGVSFVTENSDILIGLGITFALLMLVGIVLSWMLIKRLPKYD